MKRQISFALLIIGTALATSLNTVVNAAPGTGTLFGTDTNNGNLVTVNLTTGAGIIVGNTGIFSVPSLAVDPTTGILYLGEGGGNPNLYTVDPTTGATTLVGDSGLGFAAISGMDFSSDGTLYATVNIAGDGGTGGDHLATIDKTTGQAIVIGPFGTCTGVIVPSEGGGSCSIEGIGSIAFDTSGNLWAVHRGRGASGQPGLYRVSVSSGSASFITPIEDEDGNPPPGGATSIQFSCDGTLYGGTNEGRLITINTTSGQFKFIGINTATDGALGGLAFQDPCLALDHFQCYTATSVDSEKFEERLLFLEDQFGRSAPIVRRPTFVCTPVSKDGEPIVNPRSHLVCYTISRGARPNVEVITKDQFGELALDLISARLFCAPATKEVIE